MNEKTRPQVRTGDDPKEYTDVGKVADGGVPVPVEGVGGSMAITDMPPISFEGGGGAETVVSDTNPLPVDVIEVDDVDDDNIAKAQNLPLKIVVPYVFSKADDAWIRTQGSTDGYQFVRAIGMFDSGGHELGITAAGEITVLNDVLTAAVDAATTSLKTVSYEHHEIHSGSHYFVHSALTIPALNDVLDFTWLMPDSDKWTHWIWEMETSKGVSS